MNSRLNKLAISVSAGEKFDKLKNKLYHKIEGFQTPFSERRALLVGIDTILIVLAVLGSFLVWQYAVHLTRDQAQPISVLQRWYWFPILLLGWWGLAWLNDLYYIPASTHRFAIFTRLGAVGGMALLLYTGVYFITPRDALPRLFFLYFLALALPTILLWRLTYATIFKILPVEHRILIVGLGERGQAIARTLRRAVRLKYQIIGYVDTQQKIVAQSATMPDGLPVVGPIEELPQLARRLRAQEVVLAIDHPLNDELFELMIACQSWGVGVITMPDLHEKLERSIPIQHIDPAWAFHILQDLPVFSRMQLAWKRLFDMTISLLALILAAPLLLIIAAAILLDDRSGSILYQQTRTGRGGRPFQIYKFRTMVNGAEKNGQARWAVKRDPRITRVGHLLRKTRLDELPQLINILKGDMSLVGPRPERPEFIGMLEQEIPFYRTRLMVKPGLTGWAQVHGDYTSDIAGAITKLEYDLYYLRYWSFLLDIYIIFKTGAVVLKLKGT